MMAETCLTDRYRILGDPRLGIALAVWGCILRLVQYLHHRSLWLDESLLALNLLDRSYLQLLKPLDNNQGAPIGFLFVERLAGQSFGFGELALRLFPLISGMSLLFVFAALARRVLSAHGANLAIALVALNPDLVYYSSELKQYSTDVLAVSLVLLAAVFVLEHPESRHGWTGFALIGMLGVWFSHPCVLAFAGVIAGLCLLWLRERRLRRLLPLFAITLIWLSSLLAAYLVSLKQLAQNPVLLAFWSQGFVPHKDMTAIGGWLISHLWGLFDDPVAVWPWLGLPLFLLGCVAMAVRRMKYLLLAISPLVVALLASWLHKYPFESRMILFLVPSVSLLIAAGVEALTYQTPVARLASAVVVLCLLSYPAFVSTKFFLRKGGRRGEETRRILTYISKHSLPGDVCYVHNWTRFPYQYYVRVYGLGCPHAIIGELHMNSRTAYVHEAENLPRTNRLWLIYLFSPNDDFDLLTERLNAQGRQLDNYQLIAAGAILYDLSEGSSPRK